MDHTPIELLDIIFSELHPPDWEKSWELPLDGKADLHACSLVSRSWRQPAQRQLFRDTTYSFRPFTGGPDTPPRSSVRVESRYRTLAMLLDFVQHSPRFAPYIRALRLELWPQTFPLPNHALNSDGLGAWFEPSDVVDGGILHALLHSLPALTSLQLCNVNLAEDSPFPPHAPRLSLSLFSLSFSRNVCGVHANSTTVFKLLGLVDSTKELSVFGHSSCPDKLLLSEASTSGTLPGVRAEEVVFEPLDNLLLHLAVSQPTFSRGIRRVILGVDLVQPHNYQQLLSTIGEQLTELRTQHCMFTVTLTLPHSLTHFTVSAEEGPPLDLSRCRNLQRYTLGIRLRFTIRHSVYTETLLESVQRSIESLPRELSTLRELVVEFHLDVDSSQFNPRVWVYMHSRILRLLERSLKNIMDQCNPPLKHVIVQAQVVLDVEGVNNERLSTLLARAIFPELEEEGRVERHPHCATTWRSLYVQ